jgi:hypothetical protein
MPCIIPNEQGVRFQITPGAPNSSRPTGPQDVSARISVSFNDLLLLK